MASSSDKPLLERLKERKLVQWALGYLAGAWVLLEVFSTLQQGMGWPQALFPILLSLLCVGLIVTLVLAWYHGEQGRQRVSGPELLIIAGLLVVAGIGFRVLLSGDGSSEDQVSAPSAAAPEASIAVLPFEDLSPEGDQQYFVEGLSEEIINALAQIREMRVAARTSTFLLAEQGSDIATVANTLGVANVLEGSVRKAGDQLRITTQLIEAESGFHLWSETFDRELTDVFEVQDEIARAVVQRLSGPVAGNGADRLVAASTEDLGAYELYLQGRALYATRGTIRDVDAAIRYYEQAIEADPTYALAHAGAAEAWAVRVQYPSTTPEADLARAEEQARIALTLDESATRAHLALANIHRERWEWDEAEELYQRVLERLPNDAEVNHEYGEYLWFLGRCDEGLAYQRRASEVDPLSGLHRTYLAGLLTCVGEFDEAYETLNASARSNQGTLFLLEMGKVDEAVASARDRGLDFGLAVAEAVRDGVSVVPEVENSTSYLLGLWAMALIGNPEGALERISDLIEYGRGRTYQLSMPSVRGLLGNDPRYQALLEEAGITR